MCVCLLLALSHRPKGQTYILEVWPGGQVEGYLGHVHRSRPKVKVTRSKMFNGMFHFLWTCQYDVGCFQSIPVCGFITFCSISVDALKNLLQVTKSSELLDQLESDDVWWRFEDEEEYPEAFTQFAK